MRTQKRELLAHVLTALIVALLLVRLLSVSRQYPFYFIWDMDYVSTLDTMLINSQKLPDHINHPCFGMYLVQAFSERAGQGLGVVSVIRMKELATSLNPLAAMAELTTYLRQHTPYLELALVLLLWVGTNLILRPGRWLSLLFLVLLCMQESLVYHASMIRTELYAMVFWSGAFCLMAHAARARSRRVWRLEMLAAGILLGLCMLTKIQALVHLVLFGVLTVLALSLTERTANPGRLSASHREARIMMILGAVNLGIFLLLLTAVQFVQIPKAFATFTTRYTVNPITLFFGLGLMALTGAQIYFYRKNLTEHRAFMLLNCFTLVLSGFLAAFLFHFLVYDDPAVSLTYLLYDFKMIFFREIASQEKSLYSVRDSWSYLLYHPALFGIHAMLLLTLVSGHIFNFIEVRREQLLLTGILSLLSFLMLMVTVRFLLRDLIWVEPPLNLLNIFYFMMIWRGARLHAWRLRAAATAALLILLGISTAHALVMPRRTNMNFNLYGWDLNKYRYKVFENNQKEYEELMNKFYLTPRMWGMAELTIRDRDWIRGAAEFVFQNQAITQRQIGILAQDYPVWTHNMDYRIDSFPQELLGSVVVDSQGLPLEDKFFSRREYTQTTSEYMQKFKPDPSRGEFGARTEMLSVLTRQDLQVLLFVQAEDAARLNGEELVTAMTGQAGIAITGAKPEPLKITVSKAGESIVLQGIEVKKYAEIPIGVIRRNYFFVLRELHH